jgi:DNA-binding transcriptional ArsR family regulator
MVLREAGLVTDRRDGLLVYYRLRDAGIQNLLAAGRTARDLPTLMQSTGSVPGCTCPRCDSSV